MSFPTTLIGVRDRLAELKEQSALDGHPDWTAGSRAAFSLAEGLLNAVLADSLDAAWQEAEAALPEGGWIGLMGAQRGIDDSTCNAAVSFVNRPSIGAQGDTPAAALRALAVKLRERADR